MNGPDETFRAFLASGKFMLQRSRLSGEFVFYPRVSWHGARGDDLEWVEASGDAEVYSATTIRRKAEHGGDYNISLVQLAEGPRMMTRVLGIAPDQVTIGMAVKAVVEAPQWSAKHKEPVVVFYPANSADRSKADA
jgi:uncharacterized OB-fold protein